MIRVLESLAEIPGVRLAQLVSFDGVPVVVRGKSLPEDDEDGSALPGEDPESLAALATGWIGELARGIAPLSWSAPERLVLRAARGTLVVCNAPGALLIVILDRGLAAEELRLPMDAAVARLQRLLRKGRKGRSKTPTDPSGPPKALPSPTAGKGGTPLSVDREEQTPREFPG